MKRIDMENETKITLTKLQLQVLINFSFIDGSIKCGLIFKRDALRKQLKEYDEEGEILKFSDIIKAFGSFRNFVKFFREIEYS